MLTSDWLRFVPPNGIIPLNAECAGICADALDEADDPHRSTIELECREVVDGGLRWYDLASVENEIVDIGKSVAYLEARGLIVRDGETLVRFAERV